MNIYKESLQAIKDGHFFDWIGNNGHSFTKDELIRFIKEYEYAVYKNENSNELRAIVIENLEDAPSWGEEEGE